MEVVCVNREALIIALIWEVWVMDILKICALQVAILNWNFSGYLRIKTVFDAENQIDTECKTFYNWQKTNLSEDFIRFEFPWSATDEAAWFSHSLALCPTAIKFFLYVVMT